MVVIPRSEITGPLTQPSGKGPGPHKAGSIYTLQVVGKVEYRLPEAPAGP